VGSRSSIAERSLLGRALAWFIPDDPLDRRQFALLLGWLGVGGLSIGGAALFEAWRRGWIPGWGVVVGLPLLGFGLLLLGRLLWGSIATGAEQLVGAVLAGGNIAPAESVSAEEAMVLAGRVEEAMESYRRRIAAEPATVRLRLELSRLHQRRREWDDAIRLLQEIRAIAPTGEHETLVGNSLIDIYERIGDRGRLMVEYARFAARHGGTKAGAAAKRRLAELKAEIGNPPES
jgi:hypothetical protein